jgi:hypothetical protein
MCSWQQDQWLPGECNPGRLVQETGVSFFGANSICKVEQFFDRLRLWRAAECCATKIDRRLVTGDANMKSVHTKFIQKRRRENRSNAKGLRALGALQSTRDVNLVKKTCASWTSWTPWKNPRGICRFSRGPKGATWTPWPEGVRGPETRVRQESGDREWRECENTWHSWHSWHPCKIPRGI